MRSEGIVGMRERALLQHGFRREPLGAPSSAIHDHPGPRERTFRPLHSTSRACGDMHEAIKPEVIALVSKVYCILQSRTEREDEDLELSGRGMRIGFASV
jgi:hypothetical protein